ncbi:MAG TPA: hypothetical protein VKS81_07260, partial [Bacteroidota bacterium]|nr:hypothetical protein [Bacteroidota bacterium]
WHDNPVYAAIHSQSPRVRSFGGGTPGGMNDRYDIMLTSYSSLDANTIPSHYTAYGNDGRHYNDSINHLPNYAVPDSVANGLEYASDHLPVYCDFYFPKAIDTTINLAMATGWNLVSLPLSVSSIVPDSLYPNAITPAFIYESGAYYQSTQILPGSGYWLKFQALDTVPIIGKHVSIDSALVWQDWNMIGSVTDTIDVSLVISIPDSIIVSQFFGYDRGYKQAARLYPGRGYWVKTARSGKIFLLSSH